MNKTKKNEIVKKKLVDKLKEDGNDIDLIKMDVEGLVSIMDENHIERYDIDDNDMEDIIQNIIQQRSGLNSFFLVDLGSIIRRYKLWKKYLPQVEIFYAVKCNPDRLILETLSCLGVGFDVASKVELSMINELEVNNNQIIFANPVKEIDHIMYARSLGVNKMTFDNEDELKKISVFHPNAELVIRMLVDDSKSKMPFGSKFGCPMNNLKNVLTLAKQLKMNIIGVSFHVGSACMDSSAYGDAIRRAREVFSIAEEFDYKFYFLDIGGGFPGHHNPDEVSFEEIASVIDRELTESFSNVENLRIIAEPGRFFATVSGTLVTNVIGKKQINIDDNTVFHYYINSNLYGMLNNIIFDHAKIKFNLLNKYSTSAFVSTIFGQTCDSMDKIIEGIQLPELACGDWLYVINHGAYTLASGSTFNGFKLADVRYIYTF